MSYVPGEWEVRKGTLSIYTNYGGSRKPLCHKIANTKQPLLTKECQEANAKLIAAAPDMLEALRELLYVTEPTFDNRHEREAALDALAKATGEQHG